MSEHPAMNRRWRHTSRNLHKLCCLLLISSAVGAQSFHATPLNDLGNGKYKGFEGGLYENGSNTPPADHDAAGQELASQVAPIRGKFVLLSIGMSNAVVEFKAFKPLAESDPRVNHRTLAIVNGAKGALTGCAWVDPHATPAENGCILPGPQPNEYDRIRDELLKPKGLSEDQVEVIWMKNANPVPHIALPSPDAEAYTYERQIGETARSAKARYPNLKLLFLTSRIYAGYATKRLNPEPYAYENGFSVKWAIQAQVDQMRKGGKVDPIAGDLDYKRGVAPWIAWGPYIWADDGKPRSDGLTWKHDEYQPDGTHPNKIGQHKVAEILLNFFLESPYTAWFKK